VPTFQIAMHQSALSYRAHQSPHDFFLCGHKSSLLVYILGMSCTKTEGTLESRTRVVGQSDFHSGPRRLRSTEFRNGS
jgi:deoxyxylulose-5-phosphate synthase